MLFRASPSSESIAQALRSWQPKTDLVPGTPRERWFVPYRPDVNGYVRVDVFEGAWPDAFGPPNDDPKTFAAWSSGAFGPFAYPGGLERALAMPSGDERAQERVAEHRAVVRIGLSYAFGAPDDAVLFPNDRDPVDELLFLLDVTRALLDVEGALDVYNPNGETLFDVRNYDAAIASAEAQEVLPTNLWVNVRTLDHADGFAVMDTVGAQQLGQVDHEACFSPRDFTEDDVFQFLHNSIGYVTTSERPLADGHTLSGPQGSKWRARVFDQGFADPPRKVRRFVPVGGTRVPAVFGFEEPVGTTRDSFWGRWFGRR